MASERTCTVVGPSTSGPHSVVPSLMAVKRRSGCFHDGDRIAFAENPLRLLPHQLITVVIANVIAGPSRSTVRIVSGMRLPFLFSDSRVGFSTRRLMIADAERPTGWITRRERLL